MAYRILALNIGSTSLKLAVFEDDKSLFREEVKHKAEELSRFTKIIDQYEFRKDVILQILKKHNIDIKSLDAIATRGTATKPVNAGVYAVNEAMLRDLTVSGEHPTMLGIIFANQITKQYNIPSYIVDSPLSDEMHDLARISGLKNIERKSKFHALNQKMVSREYAKKVGKKYEQLTLIVAHLGGGVSVGLHKEGRVIDVNDALGGDGPFSPQRAGTLPAFDVVDLCFSGKYSKDEIKRMIVGNGGFRSYFGTHDAMYIEKKAIQDKDPYYQLVFKAFAYQVSKEIGALATVVSGKVDAIIITGGLARSPYIVKWIKESVSFITKEVVIMPGEDELRALTLGVLRVLEGKEKVQIYE